MLKRSVEFSDLIERIRLIHEVGLVYKLGGKATNPGEKEADGASVGKGKLAPFGSWGAHLFLLRVFSGWGYSRPSTTTHAGYQRRNRLFNLPKSSLLRNRFLPQHSGFFP